MDQQELKYRYIEVPKKLFVRQIFDLLEYFRWQFNM